MYAAELEAELEAEVEAKVETEVEARERKREEKRVELRGRRTRSEKTLQEKPTRRTKRIAVECCVGLEKEKGVFL